MGPLQSLVSEVEDAIASGEPERRANTLRRLTGLFIDESPKLSETHVSVFDEVILRLAREIEFRARIELSERLADLANAPMRVTRDLAFDEDIRVAGPVIERSTRLDEDDLLTIARERGQSHLLALSSRRDLSEQLTDVIVERGNRQVSRAVASNHTARFSDHGFQTLAQRAGRDAQLNAILRLRADLPAHLVETLLTKAKEKAREQMSDMDESAAGLIDETLEASTDATSLTRSSLALVDDFDEVTEKVSRLSRERNLVEDDVVRLVNEDRLPEAIAVMAKLAGVPTQVAAHAYSASHYDPLLFVVRSIKFGWPTFKLLLTYKAGREPSPATLKSAFAAFEKLSPATAQRVLRFAAARDNMNRKSVA
jgi:uncharacterized protein (DUF2336 family)